MKNLPRVIFNLALSYWIGSMAYFSFIFAPRVFRVLERPTAAQLQNALFPSYFYSLLGVSFIVLGILIWKRAPRVLQALASTSSAIFYFSAVQLTPKIAQLSLAGMGSSEEFQRLHKLSVTANGSAFFIGLGILVYISIKDKTLSQ